MLLVSSLGGGKARKADIFQLAESKSMHAVKDVDSQRIRPALRITSLTSFMENFFIMREILDKICNYRMKPRTKPNVTLISWFTVAVACSGMTKGHGTPFKI